ncbi:MAG TPA: formate dehydrogenase accessory sulfurtransferase FdhD [Sphingobium sp.]|uniref:formate dehydrogenase accessory sulfurtransferase FdhD n=1 Tax=Sphingobium sp. TaxID=1912891 RepID=UPI002ED4F8E6
MSQDQLVRFDRLTPEGDREGIERAVAVECPVALEFNGIGYAVLMATPADLEDLATGFAFSERLIGNASDVTGIDLHRAEQGMLVRVQLVPERHGAIEARVRHRVTESACGLCGIENLEQALRPLPQVTQTSDADSQAIFRAIGALADVQPGNRRTGAMHAAALCGSDGRPLLVREDVGRHNAFDKLIGAMAREGRAWNGGFALLSSRCSYELVEKAALSGCPLLVTVSAPTSLAIERAREVNLPLIVLARSDAILLANI